MSNSFSDVFTNAVDHGGEFTVQVVGRRRMPSSGIAFRNDLVITANHTVEREDDITVVLAGEKSLTAKIAGRDPARDLVVLRLSGGSAAPATPSDLVAKVGLPVIALARPEAENLEASFGIISAIGGPVRTGRGGMLEKYLRTETNPYPGFSGGPLIDLDGKLLGLNTSGFSMGALITIPVDLLWKTAADLAEHGSVRRGYLGIRSQPVALNEANQAVLNRNQESGLLLVGIEAGSPAASAGLIVGDILVSIEGQAVTGHDNLQNYLNSEMVGKSITIGVLRGGQRHDVTVIVGEREIIRGRIQVTIVSPISSLRVGLNTILSTFPEIEVTAEAASLEDRSMLPPSDITLIASLEAPSNAWITTLLEENPGSTFLFMLNPSIGAGLFRFKLPQALGFLSLNAAPEEVASAVRALHVGLWVIGPEFITQFSRIGGLTSVSNEQDDGLNLREMDAGQFNDIDVLTRRETDVLECLARGMTNKEISHQLTISEHTVKYHITSIYSKLGANNRTEAVRQGVIHGIIVI